jgi:hypothetical protein
MNLLRNWTRREGVCSAHKVAIAWPQNVVTALWLSACPRCQLLVITKVVLEDEQSNLQHRLYLQQCLRALLSFIFIAKHSGQFWLKIMLANRGMGWMRALACLMAIWFFFRTGPWLDRCRLYTELSTCHAYTYILTHFIASNIMCGIM